MGKFLSHDGQDKNGLRAEVMVQTGTGKIKNIANRGKPSEDGSYRNVEIEFAPDNPKLQHKVYGLLDTTASELWAYIQEAHLSNKDISYRIESQRRRTIARDIKFEDLKHSEQVVRVLAAIDDVFSHEAKTNPAEDPEAEAPSALPGNNTHLGGTSMNANNGISPIAAIEQARAAQLPASIVDAVIAAAIMQGVKPETAVAAGLDSHSENSVQRQTIRGNSRAVEEKPWTLHNTDGRTNPGSYAVAHAASAERFALDHLVKLYSEGKKTPVTVNEDMISQAASIAIELLSVADDIQLAIVGRNDRQKNSYNRALGLVLDSVEKRHSVPIGGDETAQAEWRELVLTECSERFIGVLAVAEGTVPSADDLANFNSPELSSMEKNTPSKEAKGTTALETSLGAHEVEIRKAAVSAFVPSQDYPSEGDDNFTPPSPDAIDRLRTMCADADVLDSPKLISDWLEANLGVRSARKAHVALVDEFLDFFAQMSPLELKRHILEGSSAAA
jgi:hypothetical protein